MPSVTQSLAWGAGCMGSWLHGQPVVTSYNYEGALLCKWEMEARRG